MDPISFVKETIQLAGAELLARFDCPKAIQDKADNSIVTDADLAAEKIVLGRIKQYFPGDAIISEESGHINVTRAPGEYVWMVDPLDGTTNFANGFPFFSVSVARGVFLRDGRIQVLTGGIQDPIQGKTYLAQRGEGATCNGVRMQTKLERPLARSFLVTGFYYTKGEALSREIDLFHKVAQVCQSIRRDGSAALDLALVAAGVYDAFWERGLAIWDVAAGSLLVEEAGGLITNYPQENSASLARGVTSLSYSVEGDGVIAGTKTSAAEIFGLLTK